MALHEELSYLDQLVLHNNTLRLEAIPYEALQESDFQEALSKLDYQCRRRLLLLWYKHYRAIAWWLRSLWLGKFQFLSEKEFEAYFPVRLEAESSIAKLRWAQKIYGLIPLPEAIDSPEELWYQIELGDFIRWTELQGLTGSPAVNQKGRLLGKAEGLDLNIAALKAAKRNFTLAQQGKLGLEKLGGVQKKPEYKPISTDVLFAKIQRLVHERDGDDTALYCACQEFVEASLKLARSVKKSANKHRAFYLVSYSRIYITGKGIKAPRPNFTKTRSRGRPPKGSNRNIKKY